MKKVLIGLLFILFLSPNLVSAHTADQPPFIKINDKYAGLYPVGSTSLDNFLLPQDLAPEKYLLSTPIHSELDTNNLPILPEFIPQLKVDWDFGDGSPISHGFKADHTYGKIGSYIMQVHSSNPQESGKVQLLDTVLINILPTPDYKLPVAFIKANNQHSANPYTDILKANLSQPIQYNGQASTASSPISSYFWDFGDGSSSSEINPRHQYDIRFSTTFALLRVTDKNGFFADNLVQLENTTLPLPGASPSPVSSPAATSKNLKIGFIVITFFIILISLGWFWKRRKSKKV